MRGRRFAEHMLQIDMALTPGERLTKEFGMQGILTTAPDQGGATALLCDMDECYCPHGRGFFERTTVALDHWIPSEDHYPVLKKDGGQLVAGNVRLAHRLCNNLGYAKGALPEERRSAAIARWRKKYSEEPCENETALAEAEALWAAMRRRRR